MPRRARTAFAVATRANACCGSTPFQPAARRRCSVPASGCSRLANARSDRRAVASSAPDHGLAMYKNILIATDESELAQKAVAQGLALARALDAKVTAVTVTEPWATLAPPEVLNEPFVQEFERAARVRAKHILHS